MQNTKKQKLSIGIYTLQNVDIYKQNYSKRILEEHTFA
jgi:hypothetical protein